MTHEFDLPHRARSIKLAEELTGKPATSIVADSLVITRSPDGLVVEWDEFLLNEQGTRYFEPDDTWEQGYRKEHFRECYSWATAAAKVEASA